MKPIIPRRRFVQGLAAAASAGPVGRLWAAMAPTPSAAVPQILSGPEVELSIGALPLTVAGRTTMATAVNGSVPGPVLHLREGDEVAIRVTNRLSEPASIHWHGIRLPSDQDGVPGLSFRGIAPGTTFTYRFPIRQSGTYWYHSHSGMQEQTGLYGALLIEPIRPTPYAYEREHVLLLSDWTCEDPMTILSNLKQQSDYYDRQQRTLETFVADSRKDGLRGTLRDRLMWSRMRMSPTDLADVTGSSYTFLANGQGPGANASLLFRPGERVRLRVINGAAMTTFDVRIPGLSLTVVAADGNDVEPVRVDEFRIGVAETYDLIVQPTQDAAYTVFAQAQDRSGFARATLAPRAGMSAPIPPLDARPLRSMADMGTNMPMPGMNMAGMSMDSMIRGRLSEPGDGLDGNDRRELTYADLRAVSDVAGAAAPTREITVHLTGNMERYIWGFDGKKFSQAPPIALKLGERVRIVLINDTMMEHPIHLHGFFFALENGQDRPPLKHTVNVKPAERISILVNADTPGYWAFHCHLMYHMEAGMFRTVVVA